MENEEANGQYLDKSFGMALSQLKLGRQLAITVAAAALVALATVSCEQSASLPQKELTSIYSEAFNDGKFAGVIIGESQGEIKGFAEGLKKGKVQGFERGYKTGWNDGYRDALSHGVTTGEVVR